MNICITGGGTGGHLMIAQALAEAASKRGDKVVFIGSLNGQDRSYFEDSSLVKSCYFLETGGVVNQKGFGKVKALLKIFKALLLSRKILKKHIIQAVYSVGGFSAAPASFASFTLFIPLFIHEQNARSGRLNAILKPFAKRFISAYEASSPIQGYPVKEVFYKNAYVRKKIKTVIFLGGSQGARYINDLALCVAQELHVHGVKIIHQCGTNDLLRVQTAYEELKIEAEIYGFSKDIASLMQRADLAISRAGASTLWELVTSGLPAIFIPYPYAASDHQYFNASFIVEHTMGWCYREAQEEEIKRELFTLLDKDLHEQSSKLLAYAKNGVADAMIEDLHRCANVK